jgi:hypothetical protein
MRKYVILRIQKLKSAGAVRRSLQHSFRERETPNADPVRSEENAHYGATSSDQAMAKFRDRLPQNTRANSVLCVEYLITASPEVMKTWNREKQDEYFEEARRWLREKHGSQNIIYAGVHRDEANPHMYAYAVPVVQKQVKVRGKDEYRTEERLSCRDFFRWKDSLARLQDEAHERFQNKFGLDRGKKSFKTKAKHRTVMEFYHEINKTQARHETEVYQAKLTGSEEVYDKVLGLKPEDLPGAQQSIIEGRKATKKKPEQKKQKEQKPDEQDNSWSRSR